MKHEMLVPIKLTALDTGKSRAIQALMDSGCSVTCINCGYAKAEQFEMQELAVPILARNADGTKNAGGRISHYVESHMSI